LCVTVKNIGTALWLSSYSQVGPVRLGTSLRNELGVFLESGRFWLPSNGMGCVLPGETVKFDIVVPAVQMPGLYVLDFDMVSEHICWFAAQGSQVTSLQVQVN
jgi:hypothetical protein